MAKVLGVGASSAGFSTRKETKSNFGSRRSNRLSPGAGPESTPAEGGANIAQWTPPRRN